MRAIFQVFSFDIFSKALMAAAGIALIRFLPEAEYALYTLCLSLVMAVTQVISSSFNRIYIVGFEALRGEQAASALFLVQAVLIAAVAAAASPWRGIAGGNYAFVVMLVVATSLADFAKTVFQQQLNFLRFSMVEAGRSLLFVLLVALLIAHFGQALSAGSVLAVQAAAMLVAALLVLRGRFEVRRCPDLRVALHTAKTVFAGGYGCLFGYFAVLAIFSQIDIFMLKAMGTVTDLATYGSAFRYYSLLLLCLGAVHSVLLPVVQKLSNRQGLETLYSKMRRLMRIFVPAALLLAWGAHWFIPWVDGGRYPEAVETFRILVASSVVSFAFSPHANLAMRFEDFRFLLIMACVALAVSLVGNLLLIPLWRAPGAAVSTLVAFGLLNGAVFFRTRKLIDATVWQRGAGDP